MSFLLRAPLCVIYIFTDACYRRDGHTSNTSTSSPATASTTTTTITTTQQDQQPATQQDQQPASTSTTNNNDNDNNEDLPPRTSSSDTLELHSASQPFILPEPRKRSDSVAVHSSLEGSQSVVLSKAEDSKLFGSEEEEFLARLSEPDLTVSKDGKATFRGLFLPPAPPPDISHLVAPPPSSRSGASGNTLGRAVSKATLKSPTSTTATTVATPTTGLATPRPGGGGDGGGGVGSGVEKGSRASSRRKTDGDESLSLKTKESLFQPKRDKYCAPG